MNPDENEREFFLVCIFSSHRFRLTVLDGINTQAAEQLFSWVKNYASILSSLGWRKMPVYLLLLFHYKNLERVHIRPTHVFNIVNEKKEFFNRNHPV
jgi:hypothetical protein